MTSRSPIDDERDLDRWVQEVTEDWQMRPMAAGQATWQERVASAPSGRWRVSRFGLRMGCRSCGYRGRSPHRRRGGNVVAERPSDRTRKPSRPPERAPSVREQRVVVEPDALGDLLSGGVELWLKPGSASVSRIT